MSRQIDERIVSMQFDNVQFERNVATTMESVSKLKDSLRFDGATRGFSDISQAAGRVDFTPMSDGIHQVQMKFSALYTYADQTMRRITNVVNSYALKIGSALTVTPIKTGFQEYETQIGAVQTILANTESKGSTLQDVNKALDELNTYADKTIYNFTEMAKNIGTFTAAGIELDTSVKAIQGIANLAAVSGSTSEQASRAMYQLSQALSSGTLKLMDWNSVVNAGMGGQVFQDALIMTAGRIDGSTKSVAELKQEINDTHGSFRESLQEGWITAEVLTKTLEHFTMAAEEGTAQWNVYMKQLQKEGYTEEQAREIIEMANTATDAATKVKTLTQLWSTLQETAQSGWTQTWEIIVGDFEEAKAFYTDISNTLGGMVDGMSKARNEILQGALSSGWKQLLGTGIVDEEAYKESINEVAKAHGVSMEDMIKAEKELDKTISDSEAYDRALKKALKEGKLDADKLTEAVGHCADKMAKLSDEELVAAGYTYEDVEAMKQLKDQFDSGELSMSKFIDKMFEMSGREKLIEALKNVFKGLMSVIKPIGDAMNEVFNLNDTDGMIQTVSDMAQGILDFSKKLTISQDTADAIKRTFAGVFSIVKIVGKLISAIAKFLKPTVGWALKLTDAVLHLTGWIGDGLVWLDGWIERTNAFNTVLTWVAGALKVIWGVIKTVGMAIADAFLIPVWDVILSFLDRIGIRFEGINTATTKMKDGITSTFNKMGESLKNSTFYTFLVGLWDSIKGIGEGIANLFGKAMSALGDVLADANFNTIFDLINGAAGSGILVFILKFLGVFDKIATKKGRAKTIQGLFKQISGGIKSFFDQLGGVMKQAKSTLKAEMIKKLATSLLILAAALAILCLLDSVKLTIAGGVLSAFIFEFMYAFDRFAKSRVQPKKVNTVMTMIIGMAISLSIVAGAIKKIGNLQIDNMIASASAIAGLMFAMVGAINLIPKRKVEQVGGTMLLMSASLTIMASAMKIVASMSWDQLAISLAGLGTTLALMITALWLIPKNIGVSAGGMIILATAMTILGAALKIFATMSWPEVVSALTALGGSLAILVTAMKLTQGSITGSVALLMIVPALVALAGVLKLMGATLSSDDIERSLIALGGSLAVLAVGLKAMNGSVTGSLALLIAVPALLALASALVALGALPMNVIGKGLIAMAGAFTVIGVAGYLLSGVAPVIMLLATAIITMSASIGVAGLGLSLIAAGITALAAALTGSVAVIVTALKTIILGIAGLIPELIEIWGKAVIIFCKAIVAAVPAIKDAALALLKGLVDFVVASIPMLTDGFLKLIIGVLEALGTNVLELGTKLFTFLLGLLDVLMTYAPAFIDKLFDFIVMAINGLAARMPELIQAGVNLIMSILEGVIKAMENIDPAFLEKAVSACWKLVEVLGALSIMGLLVPTAMAGVLAMGLLVAELTGVLWLFGKLASIPGLMDVVGDGGNLLQAVGKGIGQFFGGIVGGFAQGASSALPQIGSDLAGFMTNAKPFFDGLSGVDGGMLDSIKSLAEAILILTAADILDGLTSWFTGGATLQTFGEELEHLGTGLRDLLTETGTFTEAEVATVKCVADAVGILAHAASEIPNSGGLLGSLVGNNDLGTFADQFPNVGKALNNLLNSEEGLAGNGFTKDNVDTVKNVADAVVALATAAKEIPNSGGWAGTILGENDLGTFAEQFPNVGIGLRGLLTGLGQNGLTTTEQATIGCAAAAIQALATAASLIPNSGGWVAALIGDNKFGDFAVELPNVGTGIRGFADEIGTFTIAQRNSINVAVEAIKAIASLGEGNILKNINDKLEKAGSKLKGFGTDIGTWATNATATNSQTMGLAISRTNDIITMATRVANVSVESLNTFSESLISFAKQGIQGFASSFTDTDPLQDAKDGANALVDATVAALKTQDNYNKFKNSGAYLVSGFANGMTGETSISKAASAGASVGKAALTALNRSILVESPSKAAFESGAFFTQGAANGIVSNLNSVYNAGGEVGNDAMAGLSNALSQIGNAVETNIDAEPVIRPVVDLTNVENSASTIGSLFGTNPSMGVLANVGAISSMMNNQNGGNTDIVSAIENLRKDISNMPRNITNVNGVTYDDGSNIATAVETIVRAARIERRN